MSGNLKATGGATLSLSRSMAMVNFSFWQKWLLVVGVTITAFGLPMAFSSGTPLFDLFNRQINPAFWSVNAIDDATRRFQEWIYGPWGATIAGGTLRGQRVKEGGGSEGRSVMERIGSPGGGDTQPERVQTSAGSLVTRKLMATPQQEFADKGAAGRIAGASPRQSSGTTTRMWSSTYS